MSPVRYRPSTEKLILFNSVAVPSGILGQSLDHHREERTVKKAALGFVLGLLTPAFVFFVGAMLGVFKIEADVPPPRIESRLATAALNASIRRIPAEQNPYRVDDAFVLNGLKLFENNCAGCHGGYSKRSDWGSKHFYPPVPQFGQAPPRRSESEIFYVVQHGIRYSGMGAGAV